MAKRSIVQLLRNELVREALVQDAFGIILKENLLSERNTTLESVEELSKEGITIRVSISNCSCCQPDYESYTVGWDKLLI